MENMLVRSAVSIKSNLINYQKIGTYELIKQNVPGGGSDF